MYALIPAAGSGSRLGAGEPKQYLQLAGRPMLAHTVDALLGCSGLRALIVVVAPDDARAEDCLAADARLRVARCGGATRAASVRAGLDWLLQQGAQAADWVLVHDAARCCITPQAVQRLIDACVADAVGGLLAQPVTDTLKRAQPGPASRERPLARAEQTLARDGLWQAQTPQMFRIGMLAQAIDANRIDTLTDEASAIESLGLHPLLVPGDAHNFKVTLPGDLELAEAVLLRRARQAGLCAEQAHA